jgi:uncharacterized protein YggU (UPF0235/DUF167 family)
LSQNKMAGLFRLRADGVDLAVRLTPKSSMDAVTGAVTSADGSQHLMVRVRAAPEKGAANAALETLLAAWLGRPKRDVKLVAGGTSRLKIVRISGDPSGIATDIEARTGTWPEMGAVKNPAPKQENKTVARSLRAHPSG